MRHLKTYENSTYLKDREEYEDVIVGAGYYLEQFLKTKSFYNWEFDLEGKSSIYIFYYDDDISEKEIDEIDISLEKQNLKYKFGVGLHSNFETAIGPKTNADQQFSIEITLNINDIEKYNSIYRETEKYNL